MALDKSLARWICRDNGFDVQIFFRRHFASFELWCRSGRNWIHWFPRLLLLLPASAKYRMMCSESQRFTSLSTARLKKLRVFGENCLCFIWLAAFSQKIWQVFVLTREVTIVARFCFLSRQIELKNHLYRQFKALLKAEMFQFQAIHI